MSIDGKNASLVGIIVHLHREYRKLVLFWLIIAIGRRAIEESIIGDLFAHGRRTPKPSQAN